MSATRILWGQILVVFALTLAGVWVGSYARGTWVDEPHTAKGYQSDYDLLVIVNDKRLVDRVKYWSKLDDRLMRETMTGILHHNHGVLLPFFSPGREDEVGKALDSIGIAEA